MEIFGHLRPANGKAKMLFLRSNQESQTLAQHDHYERFRVVTSNTFSAATLDEIEDVGYFIFSLDSPDSLCAEPDYVTCRYA